MSRATNSFTCTNRCYELLDTPPRDLFFPDSTPLIDYEASDPRFSSRSKVESIEELEKPATDNDIQIGAGEGNKKRKRKFGKREIRI